MTDVSFTSNSDLLVVPQPKSRPLIFDCFMFNNEFEILETRLEILKDYVDFFVINQGSRTHQNQPREYVDLSDILSNHVSLDRVISYYLVDWPQYQNGVQYAIYQRNHILPENANEFISDNDIILLSDVDEIPNPELFSYLRKLGEETKLITFKTQLFYYYYNLKCDYNLTDPIEFSPRAMKYGGFKKLEPNSLRLSHEGLILENAGWHWSFLGNTNFIYEKLQSYGHEQFRNITKEEIKEAQENKKDLFGRNLKFEVVPVDETFPSYIRESYLDYKIC